MNEFTKLFRIKLDKHIVPQRIQELGYEACNRLDSVENALICISEASVKFERKHHKVGQKLLTKAFRIIETAMEIS